jgi:hypothetical protein
MMQILGVRARDFGDALKPAVVGCLIMTAVVLLTREVLPGFWSHGLRLLVQALAGAGLYAAALLGLYWTRVFGMFQFVREAIRKR